MAVNAHASEDENWANVATATVSDCLDRLHAMHAGIRRISGSGVFGPALTVATCAGDSATIHRAIEVAPAGSVMVIDAAGHPGRAVWGEILAAAARQRGVRGVVIDGVVRDAAALRAAAFPVYARGSCPAGPHKGFEGNWGAPIQCGGIVVATGDLVIADDDGVVVVPASRVTGLRAAVNARMVKEQKIMNSIREGGSTARMMGLHSVAEPEPHIPRDGD